MRKKPISLGSAIVLLVVGILLGSVFTFGMQYWNTETTRESCTLVETQFVSYKEIRRLQRISIIREIAIDCANKERYFIDGAAVTSELRGALAALPKQENISILIHPNSNNIVEFSTEDGNILVFDETIGKLGEEATAFLFLGFLMYFCSLVGLYYIILHLVLRKKI